MNIDQTINEFFVPVASAVVSTIFYAESFTGYDIKPILIWLVAAAAFFTIYLNFINLRAFRHALKLVCGSGGDSEKKKDGEISRFQALAASLSGTVGLGNIAGVALAVSAGGPGAVFWMMLMGFFGMSTKFAEVMLGVKYRVEGSPEHPEALSGGPMYYLKHAFSARGLPRIGIFMAAFFAICGIGGALGGGNMFQANQSFTQLMNVTGGDASFFADKRWLFGLILAVSVGAVIIGGLKSIANIASKIVPFMGILYIITGLIFIAINYAAVPNAILQILSLAFAPESLYGGFIGALVQGTQRAFFSNEAGLGSAAIVHSAVKTDKPVSQGMVGMLGPFIDTVIICMVTALVIVVSGAYEDSKGMEGVALTSRALESGIVGSKYVLALVVILFAYSTLITWSYYGQKCLTYLVGDKDNIILAYKLIFCGFVVIGASMKDVELVSDFSFALIFAMGIPNIIGLYLLAPEIKKDTKEYWSGVKKTG